MTEWLAYFSLEPFGPQAANLNAGLIACMTANVNRKKGSDAFSPKDFAFGDFNEDKKEQSVEEMKSLLMGIANKEARKKEDK